MTKIDVEASLLKLKKDRPIFHSEADFQHALAWQIHKDNPNARVRLEVPSERKDKREHIDIVIGNQKEICAIELKYKKTRIDIWHNSEKIDLRPDQAQDISRYDFIKDLVRLEQYVSKKSGHLGYAIMLTNDHLYEQKESKGKNSKDFFLYEKRILKKNTPMKWNKDTSPGTLKGRENSLTLKNNYKLNWKDYSIITEIPKKKRRFRYLLIKVE